MLIKKTEFIKSSAKAEECPSPDFPEYAFTGRSNVGKSSVINMLTGNKKLARTSSTPGKTRLINHFLINNRWYLVDLPGYGYAKTSQKNRRELAKLISRYIEIRKNLVCLFLLIDSRHSPLSSDLSFIRLLGENQVPFVLVFTKCDKLSSNRLDRNLNIYFKYLGKEWETLPEYYRTSAVTGLGKEEILDFIDSTNTLVKH
ncbi:MAG: ribosome biogenesis GTP-binding protein YihA/YsxC [Bacteroidales bacterium]